MGKNLRYTLKLSSDATEVVFTPSVSEWTDETPQPDPVTPVTPPTE